MKYPDDTEALRTTLADIAKLAGLWSETCEAASEHHATEVMERLGRIAPQVMAAIAARAAFALKQKEREADDLGVMLAEAMASLGDELSRSQDLIATESYLETERDRSSVRDDTC